MLRELQVRNGKNVDAAYKAKTAMTTGCGVVKDYNTTEGKFPAAGTADDIFWVDKERIPKGINASKENMSDYDTDFTGVTLGEFIKLKYYDVGEIFATDAFEIATKPTAGKVIMINASGKVVDATASSVYSKYKYVGDFTDNGHTLLKIEVLDKAIANS